MSRPYLLVDVEVYSREFQYDMRDDLSKVCMQLWETDAEGSGSEVIPIPDPAAAGGAGIRLLLKEGQARDPKLRKILEARVAALDPAYSRARKTGEPKEQSRLSSVFLDHYRLALRMECWSFRSFSLSPRCGCR